MGAGPAERGFCGGWVGQIRRPADGGAWPARSPFVRCVHASFVSRLVKGGCGAWVSQLKFDSASSKKKFPMATLRVLYVTDPGVHGWSGIWAVPPIFSTESDELCMVIAKKLKQHTLNKGEYICRAGDPATGIYFINRGAFSVQLQDVRFELLGPGACFGEIGAFITDCRNMDVMALADNCEVLELLITDYNLIANQNPEFALRIQEIFWQLGNARMQKLQKACKQITKRDADIHPTSLVISSAVKAMKDLEKKRRVRIWHELYDRAVVYDRTVPCGLQTLMLTLPPGSKLRAEMRTLEDAERITSNLLAAAMQMSGVSEPAARCLASCEWLEDAPHGAVAELVARSRPIQARCETPEPGPARRAR